MRATISGADDCATFIQTWTMASQEHQANWLAAMERRVNILTEKPGFISISLHRSEDGKHIVVYAQWRTEADLTFASDSPDAKAAHADLEQWGTSEGAVYRVAAIHGPSIDAKMQSSNLPSGNLKAEVGRRWAARGFTTRFIKANGSTLHLAEAGRGDPVMLLHGYPQSGEIWRLIAEDLAKEHRVLIPDLRGMGLSEVTAGGYELTNIAEDLHELTRALDLTSVSLVGHDWGGAVGAVYALRYRDEVKRLAFIESALAGGGFEESWTFAKPNPALAFIPFLLMGASEDEDQDSTAELIRGRESIFLEHLWRSFTGDQSAAPFGHWAPYVESMRRPGVARAGASYYRSAYRSAEAVRALEKTKLSIPVLSIAGEKGLGDMQQKFASAFASRIQSVIVSGAGHFVAEERPQDLSALLKPFLQGKRALD